MAATSFATAQYIKEIGRGKAGARSLSREQTRTLFDAIFSGSVSDLELGAILLAYRVKGETADEIDGMLEAVRGHMRLMGAPSGSVPVVIPSYNGARNLPNLTALLALLLAREGVPVLMHGVSRHSDHGNTGVGPDRVTTAEVWQALGRPVSNSLEMTGELLERGEPVFVSISSLAPHVDRLLRMRKLLGVRNSAHTFAKLLQPFAVPALLLTSYTHPEYSAMLADYFKRYPSDAFVMRGTEGEAVANARRSQQIDWYRAGQCSTVVEVQPSAASVPGLPDSHAADATAGYIQAVMAHELPVPAPITRQVECCLHAVRAMQAG